MLAWFLVIRHDDRCHQVNDGQREETGAGNQDDRNQPDHCRVNTEVVGNAATDPEKDFILGFS